MHDVHERLSLAQTIEFARELEKYKLFFLEDSLAPEYDEFFKVLREHTTLPLAMGELFYQSDRMETISTESVD